MNCHVGAVAEAFAGDRHGPAVGFGQDLPTRARPMPSPPWVRRVPSSSCLNRSNTNGRNSAAMPCPESCTRTAARSPSALSVALTVATGRREFQRVEQDVPEDLLQAIPIRLHAETIASESTNSSPMSFLSATSATASSAAADYVALDSGDSTKERQLALRGAIQLEEVFDEPHLQERIALNHLGGTGDPLGIESRF